MYMRLVQAKIRPNALPIIRKIYDEKIIPQLKKMKGCLFACLVRGEHQPDEAISLTLWDSEQNAEDYVKSGMFQMLLGEIKPYFSDSSEWKVQLSKDLKLEYQPVPEEEVVRSYESLAQSEDKLPEHMMYLRIVSLRILPGKMEEFKKIYTEQIIPALKSVKGCRYAYLTTGVEDKEEAISITIWDSKQDADEYEKSGVFKSLLKKGKHTYSDLYQWKMSLEKEKSRHMVTSKDVSVKYYSVLSVKGFK